MVIVSPGPRNPDVGLKDTEEITGTSASIAGESPDSGDVVNGSFVLSPSVSVTLIGIVSPSALAVSPSVW